MLRKTLFGFFKSPIPLFSNEQTISIVIDPDIFFINNGSHIVGSFQFEINPLLREWLDEKIKNEDSKKIKLYLLTKRNNAPGISLDNKNDLSYFPINHIFKDKLLSDDAKSYIKTIWPNEIQTLNLDQNYINQLSWLDQYERPPTESMLVLTANDELAKLCEHQNITVNKVNDFHQPILSEPITENEHHNLEVYTDFDGTLFDTARLMFLYKLNCISPKKEYPYLGDDTNPLKMTHRKSISFLESLKKYPTFLITQRDYTDELLQRSCNSVFNTIERINKKHNVNIDCNIDSFLNGRAHFEKEGIFYSKIDMIYFRMIARKNSNLPEEILLIDDHWGEILSCKYNISKFEYQFGIKVRTAFMLDLITYGANKENIKTEHPDLYHEIEKILNQERTNLNNTYNTVKKAVSEGNQYFSSMKSCVRPITTAIEECVEIIKPSLSRS